MKYHVKRDENNVFQKAAITGLAARESTFMITGLLDQINKLEIAIEYENKNPRPNSYHYSQSLHDDVTTIKNMLEAFKDEKRL